MRNLEIDVDTISDNSFVVSGEFIFYKKERLITTSPESVYYQPEGVKETAEYIMTRNHGKQFLVFNQLFFKDDSNSISYFEEDFNAAIKKTIKIFLRVLFEISLYQEAI